MLIRNATLPDGRSGIDVLVREGRIAALGPNLAAPEGVQVIEAAGQLLSPPFVDAHFHMDATLSHGLPRVKIEGGEPLAMFALQSRGALDAWRVVDQNLYRLQRVRREIT